jgi:hypothetical protein
MGEAGLTIRFVATDTGRMAPAVVKTTALDGLAI